MDTLRGIETFVKAVEAGSIAAAARALGISPAAASQNIARLETQLNTRLLTRTTRRLALTDSGTTYYEKVRPVVRDVELAGQAVSALNAQPQGRLCIASSAAFARHVLAPLIPGFTKRYPRIAVELVATDRSVDHVSESIDISIRIQQQLEEGLVARKLAVVPSKFCASPAYLERAGRPTDPEQLRDHDCLVFRYPVDGRFLRWGFIRNGERFDAEVHATLISDDIDVLARLAVAGGGITRLAAFVAEPYLVSGELEELFVAQEGEKEAQSALIDPLDFYICVRDRYELTPKVRAFMDYLLATLPSQWRP
ncbi:LysR family transcriptional regulator [Marinimicrobium sp. LS-A18]|uniref:LysR family transcriptional regulator n=1 Tax=Marinimicrobium sp. LS-A18 TaxID=1381596 RepID=UPI0004633BC9|nr:LysR family transcriptional regulator [Marinimicrobium sp. LS-A18]